MKKKQRTILLTEPLLDRLRKESIKTGNSQSAIIRSAILFYLDRGIKLG